MKKTGEVLRKAREEKGLSLHEVGIFLKINTRILQAIENGDLSKLPAKTFLRGFVQSYAKYLKLDSEEVLGLFQSEIKPQHEEPLIEIHEIEAEKHSVSNKNLEAETPLNSNDESDDVVPNRSSTNQSVLMGPGLTTDTLKLKTIVISTLALVLVFVVYFGNNLIQRYKKEAEIPDEISTINSSIENAAEPVPTAELSPLTPPPAETPATTPASQVVSTPAPPATVKPSQTIVTPASAPIATQQKTANETTSLPTPTSPISATPETKPIEGKSVEVIVEAKDSVEIEYASAKSNPQKLLLKNDQIHTFKSRSGIRLKISNGGAVNIIVNGQDLGAPGALGQSVQLNYE